jgi:hypothetical protein
MRMNRNSVWTLIVPLLVAALLGQGCATEALWREKYYHPAKPANLQLSVQPERQMMLVQYDEQYEKTRRIKRRAFWLDLNDRYPISERPIFLKAADAAGLQPVPVLPEITATNAMPQTGYAARLVSNQKGFELWRDGEAITEYMLPAYYANAPADFTHIALTPLALLADGVGVILAVAVIGGTIVLISYAHEDDCY